MKNENFASFNQLDFGSAKPITIKVEDVVVFIKPEQMLPGYSKRFIMEAEIRAPRRTHLLSEKEGDEIIREWLTPEELDSYIYYLFEQRCNYIQGDTSNFRNLKQLYIPAWIQYALSLIGEVTVRSHALHIVPDIEVPEDMVIDFNEAKRISQILGEFQDDLAIFRDAMPRKTDGDVDLMSTAIIENYVRALKPVEHVCTTYMTAFLGMTLAKETSMSALYRLQYDDVGFIQSALIGTRGLY